MFTMALREAVDRAQVGMEAARRDDRPHDEAAQAARLLDLIDRARTNDIDVTGWVPQGILATAQATAG
jgi:phage I-like protein